MLSDAERERIREIESLKEEIRGELQSAPPESNLSKFFKHQAILLALGFLFTSFLGSWLTFLWNKKEWQSQQSHLAQQRDLDKKYALIDSLISTVSQTNTAAEDILARYPLKMRDSKEVNEVRINWRLKSREWRVGSKVLRQELAISFSDPRIPSNFEMIVQTRRQLGTLITNLLDGEDEPTSQKDIKHGIELINEMDGLLRSCGALMASEVKNVK
ncbi:MAG TPA: hypothetical protein VG488_10520 [Candidatus Angelobacter sp.]|jgi:hypothetical protein|nr:hypothetical protein [Candidatus Angelobacter sp.]